MTHLFIVLAFMGLHGHIHCNHGHHHVCRESVNQSAPAPVPVRDGANQSSPAPMPSRVGANQSPAVP